MACHATHPTGQAASVQPSVVCPFHSAQPCSPTMIGM